jgi:small-conductance mechanosensitive channel
LFFLLDDAFRVGEFINVEETRGTVERISIRSLQLRHHLGSIHTISYGEIPKITNNSRDWTITKLRFTVPFDTDINQIKKIFKKIGQDMLMQPEYADIMLQPFKSQGVYDVDDVGIVVRGKFMSRPGTQYTLRKEIYTRVQKAFAEAGIEFARREVRVNIPGLDSPEQLTPEQQSAIAAAAEAADKRQ